MDALLGMNRQVVAFVLLWCLFAGLGDVCYKQWSTIAARPLWLLVLGVALALAAIACLG